MRKDSFDNLTVLRHIEGKRSSDEMASNLLGKWMDSINLKFITCILS